MHVLEFTQQQPLETLFGYDDGMDCVDVVRGWSSKYAVPKS